jgi:hypothetical protein
VAGSGVGGGAGFAGRRLQDERVRLLCSVRVEPGSAPLHVERDLADRLLRVQVGPLSSSDLHRIVVARFGRPLPRPTLLRVHDTAGGNPFYALEITRFLLEQARPPAAGDPLPVPPTMEELLRARIARLPRAARDALEAAALLSEPTTEALEGIGPDPAWLDQAVAAGVVELVDDQIRFAHPLLAVAVRSTMGPGRRRRLHGRLAGLVLDPEERARHLALATTGPDGTVADALEQAAQHAVLRGAPASAAELAELAAQRTPREDQEGRWRRLIEAGLRHATSGDFARARALLEPLLQELPPGPLRGTVLLNLADIGWDDYPEMISLAERALVEVDDDVSRARLHSLLGAITEVDLPGALAHLQAALEAAGRVGAGQPPRVGGRRRAADPLGCWGAPWRWRRPPADECCPGCRTLRAPLRSSVRPCCALTASTRPGPSWRRPAPMGWPRVPTQRSASPVGR